MRYSFKNTTYISITLVLIFLSVGCATRLGRVSMNETVLDNLVWPDEARKVIVPFTLEPAMTVSVTINGISGFRFIVDTGNAATLIFETERTGIFGFENVEGFGTTRLRGSKKASAGVIANNIGPVEIGIGGLTLQHVNGRYLARKDNIFQNFERKDGRVENLFKNIDGMIGYSLFASTAIEIDHDAQILTIYPSGTRPERDYDFQFAMGVSKALLHPFTLFYVRPLQGTKLVKTLMLIDTGDLAASVNLNVDSHPDFARVEKLEEGTTLGTDGISTYHTGIVPLIKARTGFRLRDHQVSLIQGRYPGTIAYGRIGYELLKNYDLYIDYDKGYINLYK